MNGDTPMDTAVALVQACLRITGYFTVTEYPVIEAMRHGGYRRGPYNFDFYQRNNAPFRMGAAIHFAHDYQHDALGTDSTGWCGRCGRADRARICPMGSCDGLSDICERLSEPDPRYLHRIHVPVSWIIELERYRPAVAD